MTIRLLLADDDTLVRTGLRAVLDSEPDLSVVGEAADGAEAVSQARALAPDVVLMDVRMPGIDGIRATELILRAAPPTGREDRSAAEAGARPRILVVTTFENDGYVYEALRAGASGFMLKRSRPDELIRAVRVVAEGELLLFPASLRTLAGTHAQVAPDGRLSRLTAREGEVLKLMAAGLTNTEIAGQLIIGVETVKTHVANVLAKLDARDRTQAVIAAYESGFVSPGS